MAWVLKSPRGKLFPDTFCQDKDGCWSEGFRAIGERHPWFVQKYWKQWDESLKAAKAMGYTIVKAKVVEA